MLTPILHLYRRFFAPSASFADNDLFANTHPPSPMLEPVQVTCPYCGEPIEVVVDPSAGSQDYVEDCFVCCRPIEMQVEIAADGELQAVRARHQDA